MNPGLLQQEDKKSDADSVTSSVSYQSCESSHRQRCHISIAQNLRRGTNAAGHMDNVSVSVSNPQYGQVGLMLRGNNVDGSTVRQPV